MAADGSGKARRLRCIKNIKSQISLWKSIIMLHSLHLTFQHHTNSQYVMSHFLPLRNSLPSLKSLKVERNKVAVSE